MKTWTIIATLTPGSIVGSLPAFEIARSKTDGIWVGQSGPNPQIQVWWADGTSTSLVDVAHALVVGVKVQVAFTYDGTTLRSYVDGAAGTTVAVATKTCIGPDCRWTVLGASTLLAPEVYVGTIGDMTLMERAVSAAGIANWYAARDW